MFLWLYNQMHLYFLLKKCKSFSHFFHQKYWRLSYINAWNFNESLNNDVVSFEQLDPGGLLVTLIETAATSILPIFFSNFKRNHYRNQNGLLWFKWSYCSRHRPIHTNITTWNIEDNTKHWGQHEALRTTRNIEDNTRSTCTSLNWPVMHSGWGWD